MTDPPSPGGVGLPSEQWTTSASRQAKITPERTGLPSLGAVTE
jgi:hypothetical protein